MTIADQFRQEGFEQGMQQGMKAAKQFKQEGKLEAKKIIARELLAEGIAISVISRVTKLSADEIKMLAVEEN